MTTIQTLTGLTKKQYVELQAAAKKEIPFRVSFRYHTQKYAYGAIDIRPIKQNNDWRWTPEQIETVWNFAKRHNLDSSMGIESIETTRKYLYHRGMHYLFIAS